MKKILILLLFGLSAIGCTTESANLLLKTENNLSFSQEGGGKDIVFSTNLSWKAVASSDWISLSADSGVSGEITLCLTCTKNSEKIEKEGTVTILSGNENITISVNQEAKQPVPISNLIYAKWVLKEGPITGFTLSAKYSQTIEFKENGVFAETVYVDYGTNIYANASDAASIANTGYGSWSGEDGIIVFCDMSGKEISRKLTVISISETTLNVKWQDQELLFVKSANEFQNIEEKLVAKWSSITSNERKSYILLRQDGTGTQIEYIYMQGSYLQTGGDIKWWTDGQYLFTHFVNSGGEYSEKYKVVFINSKYFGYSQYSGYGEDKIKVRERI